jgi:hypothetical protein
MRKPTVFEKLKNKVKDHDVSHSRQVCILLENFLSYVVTAAICVTKN